MLTLTLKFFSTTLLYKRETLFLGKVAQRVRRKSLMVNGVKVQSVPIKKRLKNIFIYKVMHVIY